jgi:hypothetical protein
MSSNAFCIFFYYRRVGSAALNVIILPHPNNRIIRIIWAYDRFLIKIIEGLAEVLFLKLVGDRLARAYWIKPLYLVNPLYFFNKFDTRQLFLHSCMSLSVHSFRTSRVHFCIHFAFILWRYFSKCAEKVEVIWGRNFFLWNQFCYEVKLEKVYSYNRLLFNCI